MRLTTVLGSVNDSDRYYMFIPKQILFWKHFGIKFLAVFAGQEIPPALQAYKENILLWKRNPDVNPAFLGQNLRIYYPALLDLPDDEMVMITDMDMLPMSSQYYTRGLEAFKKDDFVYYRNIDGDQIYMCYNAAHPSTWGKAFGISSEEDVEKALQTTFCQSYSGVPGSTGWFTDQCIMFQKLTKYPFLRVLQRPIKRLEMDDFKKQGKNSNFVMKYDDAHFHRSYYDNELLILEAEKQLSINDI
jgi:hypothetical protein